MRGSKRPPWLKAAVVDSTSSRRALEQIQLPPLHSAQQQVALDNHRFKVLACGRRWGKTRLGVSLAVAKMLEEGRVWWVAPSYQVAMVAWRDATALAGQIPGVLIERGGKAIRFGRGEIVFRSSDRADNLRGDSLDLLIMDEAAYQEGYVWRDVLRPALADRKGSALFISTPSETTGWFRDAFNAGLAENSEWRSWQFPSSSNPYLDPAELEATRGELPELIWRREFLAEFVGQEGALVKEEWLSVVQPPSFAQTAMGVDLAISRRQTADYTAIAVVGQADEAYGNELWVRSVVRGRFSFEEAKNTIIEMARQYMPIAVAVETVGYQGAMLDELLKAGLPAIAAETRGDKVARFRPVESRYQRGLIHHVPGLAPEFTRELLAFPESEHDDQVDALVYALQAFIRSPNRVYGPWR